MRKLINRKRQKLSEFLLNEYNGEMSYSALNKTFRKKDIKLNGKRISTDCVIYDGDVVESYFEPVTNEETFSFVIEYQDDNLLIIDKPCGVSSDDAYNKTVKYYPNAIYTHRLDRNTSGLLMFALNLDVYNELFESLKIRTIDKFYVAEVFGKMPKDTDTLIGYLSKDENTSTVKVFDKQVYGSQKIVTEYRVLKTLEDTSILEVKLVTGRTHQIRAHLAHVGHFIVGDGKYGDNSFNKKKKCKYQRLVAYRIEFHFSPEQTLYYLNGKTIKLTREFR